MVSSQREGYLCVVTFNPFVLFSNWTSSGKGKGKRRSQAEKRAIKIRKWSFFFLSVCLRVGHKGNWKLAVKRKYKNRLVLLFFADIVWREWRWERWRNVKEITCWLYFLDLNRPPQRTEKAIKNHMVENNTKGERERVEKKQQQQ